MKKNFLIILLSQLIITLSSYALTVFDDVKVDSLQIGDASLYCLVPDNIRTDVLLSGPINSRFSIGYDNAMGNGNLDIRIFGHANYADGAGETSAIGSFNTFGNANRLSIFGYGNWVDAGGDDAAIIGSDNELFAWSSVITGNRNHIYGSGYEVKNIYIIGSDLTLSPPGALDGLLMMGFYNAIPPDLSAEPTSMALPLLVIGNGASGDPSNALVLTKGGKATFTNKAYVAPSTSIAAPSGPETLVVEGASSFKGSASFNGVVRVQPGGDLAMGDFTASTL